MALNGGGVRSESDIARGQRPDTIAVQTTPARAVQSMAHWQWGSKLTGHCTQVQPVRPKLEPRESTMAPQGAIHAYTCHASAHGPSIAFIEGAEFDETAL
ncbi:uncharacterized protein DSM5745_05858 [Aspergillus mulundensis]|uniref:Uncharacterized protein n=1 Tax=Aspergillus mulundensis TaxID=1810919 RepID=A0A3D8RYA8_9EURO|nr:hypothetical protein DSM5745_05858 [Aspergillus mulundensis]RDW79006.1 hypothetical protein DSM5745_05858 [Aspergillus mulundensis]